MGREFQGIELVVFLTFCIVIEVEVEVEEIAAVVVEVPVMEEE
jgi:hypothetical protein